MKVIVKDFYRQNSVTKHKRKCISWQMPYISETLGRISLGHKSGCAYSILGAWTFSYSFWIFAAIQTQWQQDFMSHTTDKSRKPSAVYNGGLQRSGFSVVDVFFSLHISRGDDAWSSFTFHQC